MEKKPHLMAIILFLTGLICIGLLFGLSYKTYQKIDAVDQKMASVIKPVKQKQKALKEDIELYTAKIEKKQAADKYLQQRAQTEKAVKNNTGEHEHAPEAENTQDTAKPSVFNQVDGESADNTSSNGHIVGIDPGHQSENIDMSATEPNGPGSSTMKAKASTGTSGSFSGLPEYQLNLNVSLLLRDILEQRGYQVVMTRTDNDTAISNKERAELVASKGAEICVRIHANGDDSSGVSGALTMCPSQQNPYVSSLYDSSNRLSRCIIDSYCAATGFQNRGIIYTDSMTGINWSTIPVTIVEMGFMTNQNDDLKMADSSFQQTMAEGIANGVDAYFQ
ncbi:MULTISPECIES: N-acetylmuramoyl-L-alanine amidase family protein [Blautia]|uniref:N-acetylmuramoyl-L-alanine amidase family protein n=1 Tax=Blautia TaxID=572511 RepID=UPI001D01A25F|nr:MULTISPECIES: N-acetylmuramoyl-L-alanine amidase [Blautia]MCB5474346.1 N-acetylmuramoyl-L-alanine amidase [Blautia luti]